MINNTSAKLLMSIIVFLVTSQLFTTTIVVIYKNKTLTIGADCKLAQFRHGKIEGSLSINKIIEIDSVFFASSGFYSDPKYNFNIVHIARDALMDKCDIHTKILNFNGIFTQKLERYLQSIKHDHPLFDKIKIKGFLSIKALFIGRKNDIPFYYLIEYVISYNSGKFHYTFQIGRHPSKDGPANICLYFGHIDSIDNYIKSNASLIKNEDPVKVIKLLINLEIINEPEYVGLPIDILQVNEYGYKWIQYTKFDDFEDLE